MKVSQPPASASWLLEHLVLGEKNEALAGDLLEEFQRRRSVAWYWRQVLGAIFAGFANEMRAEWSSAGYVVAWTFGFAAIWTFVAPYFWEYVVRSAPQRLFVWLAENHALVFLIVQRVISGRVLDDYGSNLLFLSTGIIFYSAGIRSFSLRRFLRGVLVGLLIFAVEDFVFGFVMGLYGLALWRFIGFCWTWFSWLPLFIAVLSSMWMARPHWTRSEARQSSRAIS